MMKNIVTVLVVMFQLTYFAVPVFADEAVTQQSTVKIIETVKKKQNSKSEIGLFLDKKKLLKFNNEDFEDSFSILGSLGSYADLDILLGDYSYKLKYVFGDGKYRKSAGFEKCGESEEYQCRENNTITTYLEEGNEKLINIPVYYNLSEANGTIQMAVKGTITTSGGTSYKVELNLDEFSCSTEIVLSNAVLAEVVDDDGENILDKTVAGGCACPYVYVIENNNEKMVGTIITNNNDKSKESRQELEVPISSKYLIKEIEPEVSKIDYLALKVFYKNGSEAILMSNNDELLREDGNYFTMNRGDSFVFEIDRSKLRDAVKTHLISKGYYTKTSNR